jgi:peptidoglycan/xylan/chitin deacetylase (PgdA/CDA1 family)
MKRGAILLYHRVARAARDPFELCIAPELFRAQMRVVAECFEPVALDDVVGGTGGVAVTFDDGYADALDAAAICAEARVPATFFVCSGMLGQAPWWERLARLTDDDAVLRAEHARLLPLDADAQARTLGFLEAQPGPPAAEPEPLPRTLDAAGVRALARAPGCAIGAHTSHHLWLPAQDAAMRRREIEDDKATLETLLGRAMAWFSYPFGAHDDATVDAVGAAGFRAAVTVAPRALAPDDAPLRLPRLPAPALDAPAFADWLAAQLAA